jgi:hypothetical protein
LYRRDGGGLAEEETAFMGSDLFKVTVLARKGPVVSVRYQIVHPDVDAVDDSKNVALQTLTDSYWTSREGYLWDVSAPVKRRAKELADKHPRKAQLDEWLAMAMGREVELTAEQYAALSLRTGDEQPRYSSWCKSDSRCSATLEPEYAAFVAEAERAIVSVTLEDEVNHPRGPDRQRPEATMVIKVADGLVLQHLFEGLSWDSRLYDFTGYA